MSLLLSIVIPFYGKASTALLHQCLDSIRGQEPLREGMDYEIVLADTPRLTTGDARNRGMDRATGDYLFFVDADDLLLPGVLAPCLDLLRQERPDVLKFGSRPFRQGQSLPAVVGGEPTVQTRYPSGADYMLRHNFTGTVWNHFYRRRFLMDAGLRFPDTSDFDDEAFVALAYCHAGPMVQTAWPLYAYRQLSASVSRVADPEGRRRRIDAFADLLRLLSAHWESLPAGLRRDALERRLRFLTIDYLRQMRRLRCPLSDVRLRLRRLHSCGLLPLPARSYGWKYALVRGGVNLMGLFSGEW